MPDRYTHYGIAFYKRPFFQYGGRPVIYGSEEILGTQLLVNEPGYEEGKAIYKSGLSKEFQYLWVRYKPIPDEHGNVVDWTHEREWRCRVHAYHDVTFGDTPAEGIPLLLPSVYSHEHSQYIHYLPKILVRTKTEKETMAEIISANQDSWSKTCDSKYIKGYYKQLPRVKIIALEELKSNQQANRLDWLVLESKQGTKDNEN